jgi:nucleoside-diphosphate-sugar epimerase
VEECKSLELLSLTLLSLSSSSFLQQQRFVFDACVVPAHYLSLPPPTRYGPGTSEIQIVAEDSVVAEDNPRSAKLIAAEEVVRNNGGACLRLAGLYTLERGAHSFWLKSSSSGNKDVSGRADGIINLLHYDDAAGSVVAALSVGPTVVSGRNFLISDGNPVTRKQIVESALKAKLYQSETMPHFNGSEGDPIGKIYDGAASNAALKWTPRYESFDAFMSSHA